MATLVRSALHSGPVNIDAVAPPALSSGHLCLRAQTATDMFGTSAVWDFRPSEWDLRPSEVDNALVASRAALAQYKDHKRNALSVQDENRLAREHNEEEQRQAEWRFRQEMEALREEQARQRAIAKEDALRDRVHRTQVEMEVRRQEREQARQQKRHQQ